MTQQDKAFGEDEFIEELKKVAIKRGCKPLPLGWLSFLDQPPEAKEFWKKIHKFCQHTPENTDTIEEAIRYEYRYRMNN